MREYAAKIVADWPPLTDHQHRRLAVLLQPEQPADHTPAAAPRRQEGRAA